MENHMPISLLINRLPDFHVLRKKIKKVSPKGLREIYLIKRHYILVENNSYEISLLATKSFLFSSATSLFSSAIFLFSSVTFLFSSAASLFSSASLLTAPKTTGLWIKSFFSAVLCGKLAGNLMSASIGRRVALNMDVRTPGGASSD